MIMEDVSLQMHCRKCLFDASNPQDAFCRVLQHISLQDSKNMEQNYFHDNMTPSLFQNMWPSFFLKNEALIFSEKRWIHMIMEFLSLDKQIIICILKASSSKYMMRQYGKTYFRIVKYYQCMEDIQQTYSFIYLMSILKNVRGILQAIVR